VDVNHTVLLRGKPLADFRLASEEPETATPLGDALHVSLHLGLRPCDPIRVQLSTLTHAFDPRPHHAYHSAASAP
jgi:hypothetical protein